ncbi:MAG: hypothetical protein LBN02_03525 [Oscillospiraceae bacterium]|nr:hypothetical protein [Oscillospiraceae bacterium]
MEELAERLVRLETEVSDSARRIAHLEKTSDELLSVMIETSRISQSVSELKNVVAEVRTEVKNLAARPANRWEKFIAAAIAAVTTGIVTAILANLLVR